MAYTGYLAPFADLLIEGYREGLSTVALAERLYEAGARADTSEPGAALMSRQHHIRNLRAMVVYAQVRLGLRMRISRAARTLTARARVIGEQTIWEASLRKPATATECPDPPGHNKRGGADWGGTGLKPLERFAYPHEDCHRREEPPHEQDHL